jgi:hypothetical protein
VHRLDARRAEQALEGGARGDAAGLDLADLRVGPRVDHHGRSVGIRVGGEPRGAHRHERVGPAGRRAARTDLVGQLGHLGGDPVHRRHHDGALRGRKVGVELEPLAFVGVGPADRTAAVVVGAVVGASGPHEVALAPDAGARDLLGPPHETVLGVGLGEAGELDHLVDAELAPVERLGGAR